MNERPHDRPDIHPDEPPAAQPPGLTPPPPGRAFRATPAHASPATDPARVHRARQLPPAGGGMTSRGVASTTASLTPAPVNHLPTRAGGGLAPRGYIAATWARLRNDRLSMAALVLLIVIVLLTLFGPLLVEATLGLNPYRQTLTRRYMPPSAVNPFGTDDLGRDMLSRTLIAGRVSFSIGMIVAVVSLLVGVPVGLASGYYGGRFDDVSNAVIQTLNNIPAMFLLILLAAMFRSAELPFNVPWTVVLSIIIGLIGWMGTARLVRGMALSAREREYIHAAQALGASDTRIIARHLLPNVFSIVTVIAGFDIAGGILAESGLSYLGLGVQPPTASWGNMLGSSLENVSRAPWLIVFPGLAIFFSTLAIFLLADGLRDALDPRLRH
ncbi:MAG: ABC transporter permease [Chloroflexota bacterium]